jgi:multiple antibiotic resistance protein
VIWTNPAEAALSELRTVPLVRFSVLALSSIFFLVDPFAAIPSFLAITQNADPARRKRMARKGALTCFIVLTSFAVGGQLIFRMFGITLPAFEIAGGLILLLIGLDMLEAKRSPTQEAHGDTEEAAAKEDAGIVPLGIPMLAGPGAISSVMVLVGQVPSLWHWEMAAILGSITIDQPDQLLGAGRGRPCAPGHGRNRHPHPGAHHGPAAGGPGHAILRQRPHRSRPDSTPLKSPGFPQKPGLSTGRQLASAPVDCYSREVAAWVLRPPHASFALLYVYVLLFESCS